MKNAIFLNFDKMTGRSRGGSRSRHTGGDSVEGGCLFRNYFPRLSVFMDRIFWPLFAAAIAYIFVLHWFLIKVLQIKPLMKLLGI